MIVNSSVINAIDPSATGSMNAMPYVLHLKHVKVNGKAITQSPDGSYDMRLMLKRLATRLTVTWDYSVTDYKLKQLLIQSVPLNYTIVDRPETDDTYPSIVSQFTMLEIPVAVLIPAGYPPMCVAKVLPLPRKRSARKRMLL